MESFWVLCNNIRPIIIANKDGIAKVAENKLPV